MSLSFAIRVWSHQHIIKCIDGVWHRVCIDNEAVCVHSGDGFQYACGSGGGEYIECVIILRVKTGDKSNSLDASIIEASL